MKTIEITSQAQLDALPDSFSEHTEIHIKSGTLYSPIIIRKAWGSSHVVARGSSHVVARGSSHVVARGSSHVEARGSSHVVARGSSHVEARGSSHVVAWGSVAVHVHSDCCDILLMGFAVCFALAKCKLRKKSKTATVICPVQKTGNAAWLDRNGVAARNRKTILFKRVSLDLKTQEGTANETLYALASKVEIKDWNPTGTECGEGKLHACSRPYFCDEFRSIAGDRYIAIEIAVKDLHAWDGGNYPHKIAFRAGTVLYECDRYGKKIESKIK